MNFTCAVIVAEIKKTFQTEIKHHFRNLRFFSIIGSIHLLVGYFPRQYQSPRIQCIGTDRLNCLPSLKTENLSSSSVLRDWCCALFIIHVSCFVDYCLFLWPLAIVLSVLIPITPSDYPFDIFKLFLLDISSYDNKSVSHWIMFDYFSHV